MRHHFAVLFVLVMVGLLVRTPCQAQTATYTRAQLVYLIEQREQELAVLQENRRRDQENLKPAEAELADLQQQLQEVRQALLAKEEKLRVLKERIESEGPRQDLVAQVAIVEARIRELEMETVSLRLQIDHQKESIAAIRGKFPDYTRRIQELKAEIAELKAQLSALDASTG